MPVAAMRCNIARIAGAGGVAGHTGSVVYLFTGTGAGAGRCSCAATLGIALQAHFAHRLKTLFHRGSLVVAQFYGGGAQRQDHGRQAKGISNNHIGVLYQSGAHYSHLSGEGKLMHAGKY